jgi:hypothetical protein
MNEGPCTWLDDHPEALGQRPPPAHVEACASCSAQIDRLEGLLRGALVVDEEPLPIRLRARIVGAVTAREKRERKTLLHWPALVPTAAAVALAVMVIGGVMLFMHFNEAQLVAEAQAAAQLQAQIDESTAEQSRLAAELQKTNDPKMVADLRAQIAAEQQRYQQLQQQAAYPTKKPTFLGGSGGNATPKPPSL